MTEIQFNVVSLCELYYMSVSPPVKENESRISFDDYSFVLSFHLERAIQVILEGGQLIHFQSK